MSDSDQKTIMVKKCRNCGNNNHPDEDDDVCQNCDMDLSTVLPTPLNGSASAESTEEGNQSEETAKGEEQGADGNRCPDCREGTIRNNRCSICDPATFSLTWQDKRVENITIRGEGPVFIGRVPPVEIALIQQIESFHPAVSRIHAELYIDGNGCLYLRDLGSKNGTKVNKRCIPQFVPQQLKVDDEVAFSSSLCARIE